MAKISIDGFQELFEAVRGMRAEFEGMVVAMRSAGGAASGLASQIRGPTQSPNIPINKGKGVYRPTSSGNVLTFPNASIDTEAMRQQVEEANAAQQAARGMRLRRPSGVGGIDLSTMISGGDPSTTIARGAVRMQSYKKGLADTSKLMDDLAKASSPDARIIQQALQQSQGRIGDLQARIAATKSGMYDASGNATLGDAELKRELKKLASLTEKQVRELEKANKLEESARQLGFGGGGPGGPGGFMQGLADRFGGYGRAAMFGAAGAAHVAQMGFGAFANDYRMQSGVPLDIARNIGSVAGGTFSRRMMANDTDPASLVRFYGDALLGTGFASRAQYVGVQGTRNANAEAIRSSELRSSALTADMGAAVSGLVRNTALGAAGGAIGGSIIPGLGTMAGGVVGGIGGLATGIAGMASSVPEFLRARGITLGGLLDSGVASRERMRYATGKAAEVAATRSALEEADMQRFQDSVYGVGQIREAIEARKAATASIGGMATDALSLIGSATGGPSVPVRGTQAIVAEMGRRMRESTQRAAVARAMGRMPAGVSDFGNIAAPGMLVDSGRGGREPLLSVQTDGPMQLSGFGRMLAENQMSYSMYAQSANMLSGSLGRRAGVRDTMGFVQLGRAGVGSQEQIAGNLMGLASTSNAAGIENLKKIFGEAFAAGLKGSGFVQQFASLTQNLSAAIGVTNAGQVATSLRGGTQMFRGLGDSAQVGMGAAALGMQQFNNFSSMSGGVPGVLRAFGISMGGGTMSSGGSSIFNMNAQQLAQTTSELSGPVDKMGSRTQMLYRNLRYQGMSDEQARESLRRQIRGATEMTSVSLAGVFNRNNLASGKKFDEEIAKLKTLSPDSAEFKQIVSAIGLAGEQTADLGREGALAMVQSMLGTDSSAASKAINREIASGNAAFSDPLNRKKFEFRNSLTEMTQAQRSSRITESEYLNFLNLGDTSPVMARVGGRIQALTKDLLTTPEGKKALENITRDELVAATRNSMTEGLTESAVYIKYLDPVAVKQFTDVFRNSGVDVAAPRTGQ